MNNSIINNLGCRNEVRLFNFRANTFNNINGFNSAISSSMCITTRMWFSSHNQSKNLVVVNYIVCY